MTTTHRLATVFVLLTVSIASAGCSSEVTDSDITVDDNATTQSQTAFPDPKLCPTRTGTLECRGNEVGSACTTSGGAAGSCVFINGGGLFSSLCRCQ